MHAGHRRVMVLVFVNDPRNRAVILLAIPVDRGEVVIVEVTVSEHLKASSILRTDRTIVLLRLCRRLVAVDVTFVSRIGMEVASVRDVGALVNLILSLMRTHVSVILVHEARRPYSSSTAMKFSMKNMHLDTSANWDFWDIISPVDNLVIVITVMDTGTIDVLEVKASQVSMPRRNRRSTHTAFTSALNMTTLVMVVI